MLLAKLVSSGLASLSVAGLGLYFAPKYSVGNHERIDSIYQEKELANYEKLSNLDVGRKKLLKLLGDMHSKFQTVTSDLKKKKEEKHFSMNKSFETIKKEEEVLKAEYEKSKKWLEEIEKMVRGIFGANQRKLELEAIIRETDYLNESLAKMYGSFYSWGFALEQFICVIDNQDQTKTCNLTELKDWLNSSALTSSSVSTGGGTLKHRRKHSNS